MIYRLTTLLLLLSGFIYGQRDSCIIKFQDKVLNTHNFKKFPIDSLVEYKEIRKFNIKKIPSAIILENGYASSTIKNPHLWRPDYNKIEVTEVEVVFTKYPVRPEKWITNYNYLLRERLKALFKLDPKLNCQKIVFRLLLQTDCSNDSLTRTFFHGFVIKYRPVIKKPIPKREPKKDSTEKIPYHTQVEAFIKSQGGLKDSTAYKIFDRHPEWKKSLVVMDWTSSMYPYGASVVLWHALHFNQSGIKFYTFFNDGDNRPEYAKKINETGGIYHAKADNLDEVIKLFRFVMSKGTGGDIPENDIEAILKAEDNFPDFSELILIADNNACIRDFILSDSIKVPVKIILCGTENGINPMFINLAAKTKGSLHTIEEDIYSMQESGLGQEHINIGGVDFSKNQDGLYVRTDGKKEDECIRFYSENTTPVKKPKTKPNIVPPRKKTFWEKIFGSFRKS